MKDWKTIASASGLGIPDADLERIAPALESLESAFRPLSADIPGAIEPAVTFRAEEEFE
jgi:hypothetical protein